MSDPNDPDVSLEQPEVAAELAREHEIGRAHV